MKRAWILLILALTVAAIGRGVAGRRRAGSGGRHPQTLRQAPDALYRSVRSGDRPAAGDFRSGVSAMAPAVRRQGRQAGELARHGLPDEAQGPLRRDGAPARPISLRFCTATPSHRARSSGFSSSRATSIAASCSCTKEHTASCSRYWEPRGPPWYMPRAWPSTSGTHRWSDGRLTLGAMPHRREESPYWRRIGIIQDAVAQHRALRLKTVIELPSTRIPRNEALRLVLGGDHAA